MDTDEQLTDDQRCLLARLAGSLSELENYLAERANQQQLVGPRAARWTPEAEVRRRLAELLAGTKA